MAKQTKIDAGNIIKMYMDYVLETGEQPVSVHKFAKENKFEEGQFYDHFGSFEGLKKSIFDSFAQHTLELLNKNDEYLDFDAKNKLLSFYYTFFEILKANRSYILVALNGFDFVKSMSPSLDELKHTFFDYVQQLGIEKIDLKNDRFEKIQERSTQEVLWRQLMITMKFWIEDDSKGFEKTDIFIEKSITTGFQLIDSQPIKSLIDLGKFLYKEKVRR